MRASRGGGGGVSDLRCEYVVIGDGYVAWFDREGALEAYAPDPFEASRLACVAERVRLESLAREAA